MITLEAIKDLNVPMRAVNSHLKRLENTYIKVGYPGRKPVAAPSKKGSGRKEFTAVGEVATIAFINDQERPFLNQGIAKGNPKIRDAYGRAVANVLTQKTDSTGASALIGEVAVAAVKREIRDGNHKANAPITVMRKGSSKPLIDTAQMINSTTFEVQVGKAI